MNIMPKINSYIIAIIIVAGIAIGPRLAQMSFFSANNVAMQDAPDKDTEELLDSFMQEEPEPEEMLVTTDAAEKPPLPIEQKAIEPLFASNSPQNAAESSGAEPNMAFPQPTVKVRTPADLRNELPKQVVDIYEAAYEEGIALLSELEEGTIPSYEASLSKELIRQLVSRGLAKLAVPDPASQTLFLFKGIDPDKPGDPFVASRSDLNGMAARFMMFKTRRGNAMLTRVKEKYQSQQQLSAGILFRCDLDAIMLAAQSRAARNSNLPLKSIAITIGQFEMAQGLPFAFRVIEIITVEGERIRAGESI